MSKKRERTFLRHELPSVVWNREKDRPLAEFVNGECRVADEAAARVLLQMGYEEVGAAAAPQDQAPPDGSA